MKLAQGAAIHICSFHDGTYRAKLDGREFAFDFSERLGPLILSKNGRVAANQDASRAFWAFIDPWVDQGRRVCHECGCCLWRTKDTEIGIHIWGRQWLMTRYVVLQDDRCGCTKWIRPASVESAKDRRPGRPRK